MVGSMPNRLRAENRVDEIKVELQAKKASMRCGQLCSILEELGFIVKPCRTPGHRTATHPGLEEFFGLNFDCGHGNNSQLLKNYVVDVLRVVRKYEEGLVSYLEKTYV